MNEDQPEGASPDIPLAETIQTLRRELQLAQLQSANEGILFEIEKIELELKVAIGRKMKGQGGVEFYVIKAGGEVENSGETTHNVKLTLSPVTSQPEGRLRVSAQTKKKPSTK